MCIRDRSWSDILGRSACTLPTRIGVAQENQILMGASETMTKNENAERQHVLPGFDVSPESVDLDTHDMCYTLPDGKCVGACLVHHGYSNWFNKFIRLVDKKYIHPLLFSHTNREKMVMPPSRAHQTDCGYDMFVAEDCTCLLYTSPSPRDRTRSRMPSSA